MYLPRLRTKEQIIKIMKAFDSKTDATVHLLESLYLNGKIAAPMIGNKRFFNMDEFFAYFTKEPPSEPSDESTKRKMATTGRIVEVFRNNDKDSILRKSSVRTMLEPYHIHYVRIGPKRIIDTTEILKLFNPNNVSHEYEIPILRYKEKSYAILKRKYPKAYITWDMIHNAPNTGNVSAMKFGKRWLMNFTELETEMLRQSAKRLAQKETFDSPPGTCFTKPNDYDEF